MEDDDPLVVLGRWLAERREQIGRQVTVRARKDAYGERTTVAIDHRLICDLEDHAGWLISTNPTYLFERHFDSHARMCLKNADVAKGRTIYCHDLSLNEVVAGISYHIHDRSMFKVMVTMIGLRSDTGGNAAARLRTLEGALVAKHHVHAIADKVGRGGHIDLDLADRAHEPLVRRLGFQKAPRVRGMRPGGLHLRQQRPGG